MKKILVLLVCFVLCGCQNSNPSFKKQKEDSATMTRIIKTELAYLNLQNPESDLKRNFARGDKRFISICGYACVCPGVSDKDNIFVERYGAQNVEGTSDAIESEEHLELIRIAEKYAENYNQALIKKLKIEGARTDTGGGSVNIPIPR